MRKYVVMGPQGSGKGTQAKLLREGTEIVHISVGDILRWNIQSHTKLGAAIARTVAEGHLVSDDVIESVVKTRLDQHDWNFGFVIDGFPRNERQALFFLESYDITAVLEIDVPDHVVTERILARRLCSECGLDYNLIHSRPAVPDRCDVCGGVLKPREDDEPDAIARRLQEYRERNQPILELFRKKGLVLRFDGELPIDTLQAEIRSQLGLPGRVPAG